MRQKMGSFIDDIELKGSLAGLTVRSAITRGRITKLSTPPLPEGCLAVTAKDIPGRTSVSSRGNSMPFLADSAVNYFGEPIMLLAGPDREVLSGLAARIQIEYEEKTPLLNPAEAGEKEVVDRIRFTRGEPDPAFREAYQIVESSYQTGAREHLYPDSQGAAASWNGRSLTLYAATQDPFSVRRELAEMLGLPERKIRVIVPCLCETLEGKFLPSILIAGHAALLSYAAGRPVKLVYDREEDFCFTPKSLPSLIHLKTALDRNGNSLAMKADILLDAGAYKTDSSEALVYAALAACGAYRCRNMEVEARLVVTNKVPSGLFRGAGRHQAFFAIEMQSARLAEISQMDPYVWKKKNLLSDGEITAAGGRMSGASSAGRVLDEVVGLSDFRRKYAAYSALKKRRKSLFDSSGPLRGIGLSICCQGSGHPVLPTQAPLKRASGRGKASGSGSAFGTRPAAFPGVEKAQYSIKVRLERDRKLKIFSSLPDMGQGLAAGFKDLAAKILEMDTAKVRIEPIDTKSVPDTGPATMSRAFTIGAGLVEQCCLAIKKRRITSSLPIEVKRSYKRPQRLKQDPDAFKSKEAYAWAGTVVDLEVDPITLESVCLGIWTVVDAGDMPDKRRAAAQFGRGIIQALGGASMEVLSLDLGRLDRQACTDYHVPGILDVPPVFLRLLEGSDKSASAGPKEFLDLPFLGLAPAYAAAVSQATGLYLDRIPLTPEVVQECLEES